MLGIQIAVLAFIVFMLYVVRIHFMKKELPKVEAYFWFLSLCLLAILVVLPNSANFLVRTFAVTRLTDLVTIAALMGSFVLLIENRIQLNKLRHKLETIVREKAIKPEK